jgi:sugar phosphate isomerase/epimerase
VRSTGYRAAYCPISDAKDDAAIQAFIRAAKEADIVIAEVGAWSNPISPNEEQRQKAIALNKERLLLADKIGANCCVNIAGSRNAASWHGPDPADLTEETFALIVDTVRGIIDEVRPTRTAYCLETMPWSYPDSPDSYLRLIRAIDRKGFAVHLDPTNLVCSPQRYAANGALIRECFEKLGPHIRSVHAKDIALSTKLMVHLDEVRAGLGALDYRAFLQGMNTLAPDIPIMMEHLPNAEEYAKAGDYIRSVARSLNIALD